jgi:aspartate/methionine/tyrosine aminotransferase
MPTTQAHEVTAAKRLENVRYAIRDLACVADEVIAQGHKVLPLNVGDPLNFDFQSPAHIIEAAYKAMRDGKNGFPRRWKQFAARPRARALQRCAMSSSLRA